VLVKWDTEQLKGLQRAYPYTYYGSESLNISVSG
jgi:hypothetical protein